MSEKCGVCGRPKGDYHRRPVAGECTAPDPTDYTVSLQCASIALRKAQDDVAAAEERGRWAGIEEAAKISPALLDRVLHVLRKVAAGQEDSWTSTIARAVEIELRKALAPRDSGKTIPSVASQGCPECSKPQPGDLGMGSIEARQLRCTHGGNRK